jgi:hypothetical protein
MSISRRPLVSLLLAVGSALVVSAPAAADPDIHGQSAATVIDQYQHEGYAVTVNGSPAGDTSLLRTCTVTSVDKPGGPTPDPTTATVHVSVACPLTHG